MTIKLLLLVSVILVGALLLGPSVDAIRGGDDGVEGRIVAGAAWDVVALTTAAVLSVYKPGRPATPAAGRLTGRPHEPSPRGRRPEQIAILVLRIRRTRDTRRGT